MRHRLAHHVAARQQPRGGRVDELEHMIRAVQGHDEVGCLLEHLPELLNVKTGGSQQRLVFALHHYAPRCLDRDDRHAAYRPGFIPQGCISHGEVAGLWHAGWLNDVCLVFQVNWSFLCHHLAIDGLVELPDFVPAIACRLAQRCRVAQAKNGPIGVVINLQQLRAPQHNHRQR